MPDCACAVRAYLAANRAADGRPAAYGLDASIEGSVVRIALTFRKGRRYCCAEPGCHLGLFEERTWLRLHEALADSGMDPCAPLTVFVRGTVEEGALLGDRAEPVKARYGYSEEYIE